MARFYVFLVSFLVIAWLVLQNYAEWFLLPDAFYKKIESIEAVRRLRHLNGSEIVHLDASVVRLMEKVDISLWNVTIIGAPGGTTVFCPPDDGAFYITGSGIQLERLHFRRCRGQSPIVVRGIDDKMIKSAVDQELSNPECLDVEPGRSQKREVRLIGCSFIDNDLELSRGGLGTIGQSQIDAGNTSLTIADCIFRRNYAPYSGGAVFVDNVILTMQHCIFEDNGAGFSGGAIDAEHSVLLLQDVQFDGNSVGHEGGAIAARDSFMRIQATVFRENDAGFSSGGAICVRNGSLVIQSSIFVGNTAELNGGAIAALSKTAEIRIQNSDFKENDATRNGGALYTAVETVFIQQSNFTRNSAGYSGGAIRIPTGVLHIQGSFIADNTAGRMDEVRSDCGHYPSINRESFIENILNYQRAAVCVNKGLVWTQATTVADNAFV